MPSPSHEPSPELEPSGLPPAETWLIACSPGRRIVGRRQGEAIDLVKIFEQGSLAEAQHEADLAAQIQQPGVVRYRQALQDPVSSKPAVVMDFVRGQDLGQRVLQAGPLPAEAAARVALQLAEILTRLHDTKTKAAPYGVVHRDIKPGNVFLAEEHGELQVTLIDLEHMTPRAAPGSPGTTTQRFSGGSHGYAPPEAYRGHAANPSFDVFGLGATLFYLLTASRAFSTRPEDAPGLAVRQGLLRFARLDGQPNELRQLVRGALDPDPEQRWTLTQIHSALQSWLEDQTETRARLDDCMRLLQEGTIAPAAAALESIDADAPAESKRKATLADCVQRCAAFTARHSLPGNATSQAPETGQELLSRLRQWVLDCQQREVFLRRVPAVAAGLEQRHVARRELAELLVRLGPAMAECRHTANFELATSLLDAAATATRQALSIDPSPVVPSERADLPGLLERDPLSFLERLRTEISTRNRAHQKLMSELQQTEAKLDRAGMETVIHKISAIYSGASPVVALLKDRIHRLEFYLSRLSQPIERLDQLTEHLQTSGEPCDLQPVLDFQNLCSLSLSSSSATPLPTKGGVYALYRTIVDLQREFPQSQQVSGEAKQALQRAMNLVTDLAWQLLADARDKLGSTPLPIRPINALVSRLDRMALLQAFVDREGRTREGLLDEIEWTRMRLEQARTTRDSIARGAQESAEKGHLTTALYDMARAVESFEDSGERSREGGQDLRDQYEAFVQTKARIDKAMSDNRRLAAWYHELQDRDHSELNERLDVLQRRADVLQMLVQNLDEERAEPFLLDLREVQTNLMQERADDAEQQMDRATTAAERLQIASRTNAQLQEMLPGNRTVPGRLRRLLEHWQLQQERAAEEIQASDRQRRTIWRRLWIGIIAGVALGVGLLVARCVG